MLKGKKIFLRQLSETDASTLLLWENDPENWRYSESEAPYSLLEIQQYISSASQIRLNKQLRLMICKQSDQQPIGAIDLFEIDFKNERAGVGILIAEESNRRLGFASEALQLMIEFAFSQLPLHQLYCHIRCDNNGSQNLFTKNGFQLTGTKHQWYKVGKKSYDALFYQKIRIE